MFDKPCIGFADIEAVAVVGNDDISLVKNPMEVFDQIAVIILALVEAGIVGERLGRNAPLALPLVRKAEHVPLGLRCDDVALFPFVEIKPEGWGRLDVHERHAGLAVQKITYELLKGTLYINRGVCPVHARQRKS